ncbi:MAG: VacJ family lipoprotein [Desulfobacterales bacterium]|nr:VacJ family lipoprotein [Desulfobacterales bacterium]
MRSEKLMDRGDLHDYDNHTKRIDENRITGLSMGQRIREEYECRWQLFISIGAKLVLLAALWSIIMGGFPAVAEETPRHWKTVSGDPLSQAEPAISGEKDSEFGGFDEFEEFESEDEPGVFDPLIGYNRIMTRVNDRLYFWVLKPSARAYGAVMPKFARQCIRRFFDNLGFPVRFANNLLQLKLAAAGIETARFSVNSTLGIAGFMDPAKEGFNLTPKEEDFGQTLGHYGLSGGFHLVLPLLGPSNFRDTLGAVPDDYLDPVYYVPDIYISAGAPVFRIVNQTSLSLGQYESFSKDAMDMYILFRNAYEQNRKREVEE